MSQPRILDDAKKLAVEIDIGIRALPIHNTPSERAVRCCCSHQLRGAEPAFVPALARELVYTPALELPEIPHTYGLCDGRLAQDLLRVDHKNQQEIWLM
jgi:hypothetical protein